MLKRADLTPDANVFDCGIAAYLLNPLKSTYTYEELYQKIICFRKPLVFQYDTLKSELPF